MTDTKEIKMPFEYLLQKRQIRNGILISTRIGGGITVLLDSSLTRLYLTKEQNMSFLFVVNDAKRDILLSMSKGTESKPKTSTYLFRSIKYGLVSTAIFYLN